MTAGAYGPRYHVREATGQVVRTALTVTHEEDAGPEARVTRRQADIDAIRTSLFEASTGALVS